MSLAAEKQRKELAFFETLIKLINAKTVVEIGVAHGIASTYLCRGVNTNGGQYIGFDIWEQHGLNKQFTKKGSKEYVIKSFEKLLLKNYTLIKIDTINKRNKFLDHLDKLCPNGIDFAFIDGCHSYDGVSNDFFAIYPKLSVFGIVAFHDTALIDGCREFSLDLKTKYNDGTFDIVDLPFGGVNNDSGITLLIKRSLPLLGVEIKEICGSPSSKEEIIDREKIWYKTKMLEAKINQVEI